MDGTFGNTSIDNAEYLSAPDNRALDHIPGERGLPIIGQTIRLQKDIVACQRDNVNRFGQPSRIGMGLQDGVMVTHPDHLKQVYLDKDQSFSSTMGYDKTVGRFYGGSFIMQDFGDHKLSRRVIQGAFKNDALKGYVDIMNPAVVEHVSNWGKMKDFRFGAEVKSLLIDVGARVFFGIDGKDKELLARIEKAFNKINDKGLMAVVNVNFPGFKYHTGLQGKREIEEIIVDVIRLRRKNPGNDLTSILCQERDENGELWPEEVLVPHLSILLFAAHDTTVGATSCLMMYLADPKYRHLQDKLRQTVLDTGIENPSLDDLNSYDELEWAIFEALRLHPSAGLTARRAIRDVKMGDLMIPANTLLFIMTGWVHRSDDYWTNPDEFDPLRFSPERKEHKNHAYCYVPFGGGAHKCIGLHVAMMNAKLILHHALKNYSFDFLSGYKPEATPLPLPMPVKQLPLNLTAI
jgi:cytochrome P450